MIDLRNVATKFLRVVQGRTYGFDFSETPIPKLSAEIKGQFGHLLQDTAQGWNIGGVPSPPMGPLITGNKDISTLIDGATYPVSTAAGAVNITLDETGSIGKSVEFLVVDDANSLTIVVGTKAYWVGNRVYPGGLSVGKLFRLLSDGTKWSIEDGPNIVTHGHIRARADNKVVSVGESDDALLMHDGTNSQLVNTTGKLTVEQAANADLTLLNTGVAAAIVAKLGTTTNATKVEFQDSAADPIFQVLGNKGATFYGGITVPAGGRILAEGNYDILPASSGAGVAGFFMRVTGGAAGAEAVGGGLPFAAGKGGTGGAATAGGVGGAVGLSGGMGGSDGGGNAGVGGAAASTGGAGSPSVTGTAGAGGSDTSIGGAGGAGSVHAPGGNGGGGYLRGGAGGVDGGAGGGNGGPVQVIAATGAAAGAGAPGLAGAAQVAAGAGGAGSAGSAGTTGGIAVLVAGAGGADGGAGGGSGGGAGIQAGAGAASTDMANAAAGGGIAGAAGAGGAASAAAGGGIAGTGGSALWGAGTGGAGTDANAAATGGIGEVRGGTGGAGTAAVVSGAGGNAVVRPGAAGADGGAGVGAAGVVSLEGATEVTGNFAYSGYKLGVTRMFTQGTPLGIEWLPESDGTLLLPAAQAAKSFVGALPGIAVGDRVVSWTVQGTVESAGNAVDFTIQLRRNQRTAGIPLVDELVQTYAMPQKTADFLLNDGPGPLNHVVHGDWHYYLFALGTTGAANCSFNYHGIKVVIDEK